MESGDQRERYGGLWTRVCEYCFAIYSVDRERDYWNYDLKHHCAFDCCEICAMETEIDEIVKERAFFCEG